MRRYDFGSVATLRHTVTDEDGTPTDADVSISVVDPDGQTSTPTPTHAGTGVYDFAVPADDYGLWRYTITVSGAVQGVKRGKFYVADDDDEELPPLASVESLGRKLGYVPEGLEADRAGDMLDAASTLIRDLAEKTWVEADTGVLEAVPRAIVRICVEAAYRAFGNPEGLSQRSIGDSSKSYDRAKREGGEAVYLTDAEKRRVLAAAVTSSPTVVTMVSPYSGDPLDDGDLVWSNS
jgi:hypothetical protein